MADFILFMFAFVVHMGVALGGLTLAGFVLRDLVCRRDLTVGDVCLLAFFFLGALANSGVSCLFGAGYLLASISWWQHV